ncbi:hypothetical protein UA08_06827 [Talaromyces atroroseus]|uniref:Uncharacterized protein n=1 Tax=Talaromyces atroroseus TaxID=1441469 RepID=A0A225AT80_TALAT|nr:hypothetical protein UA08_06827 [Talaromyces atroroseus]OKL58156.1 hypothetical protein UA08_06827 [Talaromyces atroroseus]
MESSIPLHSFDNTHFLRSLIICMTFHFDDTFNVDELHESLKALLQKEDWKKLGGRILQRGYNRYGVRLVRPYEYGRVSVRFSEACFNMSIKDHALASKMFHQTDGPSVHPGVEQIRPLCTDGNGATSFKEYIGKSIPQISLRVVTFTDGTLISVTWPHTMTDGRGWADVFRAWCAMLAKKPASIPRFMGYDLDNLEEFGFDQDIERSVLEPEKRPLSALPARLVRQTANIFLDHKMESRVFCLPADTIEELDSKTTDNMTSFYWVTEADVVKGWATNVICSHMGSSNRRVCIHSFFDLRDKLTDRFPAVGAFIQNATFPYLTQLRAIDLVHGPFGDTAVAVRKSCLQQGTPEQLAATAKLLRTSGMRDRYPVLGDPDGYHVYFLDWSNSGLLNAIDFSSAVEESSDADSDDTSIRPAGDDKDKADKGKPSHFQVDIVSKSDLYRQDVFNLYGRDRGGNYWFGAVLHRKAMGRLEAEMARLQHARA